MLTFSRATITRTNHGKDDHYIYVKDNTRLQDEFHEQRAQLRYRAMMQIDDLSRKQSMHKSVLEGRIQHNE